MGGSRRVPELDGLRGIAILAVMLYHFTPISGPLRFLYPVFQTGWIGVDLFFVLSGYLITGILVDTAGRRGYYRNFIIRRILRIFPLYYACLALYCVLTYFPSPILWKDFARANWWYFAYLGNFRVFLDNRWPDMSILTPLWSLQIEEQFYLFFPLLVWALRGRTLAKVLAVAAVAAPALRGALALALPENLTGAYVLAPCRMDALAMGGLLAVAVREWPERLKSPWVMRAGIVAGAVFVCICLVATNSPWTPLMRTIGYSAADLAFACALAMLTGGRPRALAAACRARPLVFTGTISYGLYLLHIPGSLLARRALEPFVKLPLRGSADLFVSMGAAILLAWASWKAFESPVLRLKNRFTSARS